MRNQKILAVCGLPCLPVAKFVAGAALVWGVSLGSMDAANSTYTYTGATSTWSTPSNWSLAGGPGNTPAYPNAAGDVLQRLIAGNVTVTQDIGGGVTVGRITQSGSATFTVAPTNGITLLMDGVGPASAVISNNAAIATNAALALSASGTITLADSLSIINSGVSTAAAGAIQIASNLAGTANITINNISNNPVVSSNSAGQIRITGSNSAFTGTVTLERGTVSFNQAAAFGNVASNLINIGTVSDATLIATSSVGTLLNNIAVGTGGVVRLGANITGNVAYSGAVTLNGYLNAMSSSTAGNGVQFSGVMSGAGGVNVEGAVRLTGTNTFTGDTRVVSGTLQVGANVFGDTQSLALQNSTVDMNASDSGVLQFGTGIAVSSNITSATFGGLKGSRNLALTNAITPANSIVLSVGANNSGNTYSGTLSGGGSFVKVGTGTQTISGVQTYTGSTTVNAGTLLVTGGLAASSPVIVNGGKFAAGTGVTISNEITVNSGGRIGGGGTFTDATGITLASGAIVAPGNSPGNTTFGTDLNFNSGAVYEWELGAYGTAAGTDSDLITVTGAGNVVTFDSGSVLTLNFLSPVVNPDNAGAGNFWLSNHQWMIVDADAGGSIVNNGLVIQAPSSFANGSFAITSSGGDLYLTYLIPEPSTSVLCGFGLMGTLYFFRRRRA